MSEDELEELHGRKRRIVAAHLSLPGRPRVARHNKIQKATADFDEEGHRRTERGRKMNNNPFDRGLKDLVSDRVYRKTSEGYYLVSMEERFAEDVERVATCLRAAVAVSQRIPRDLGDAARLYRLMHPPNRIAKSSKARRLRRASGPPPVEPGDETWGDFRERARQLEQFFAGRRPDK